MIYRVVELEQGEWKEIFVPSSLFVLAMGHGGWTRTTRGNIGSHVFLRW